MVRKIAGKSPATNIKHLNINYTEITEIPDIANYLGQTFSNNSSSNNYSTTFQGFRNQAENQHLKFKSNNFETYNNPFSLDELGTSAIRLPGATSIFNAELHAILLALDVVQRSKEKHFLLLSDSYSSLIALGGSHVDQDTIYKYLKTYSTLTNSAVKQSYSAGSPVTCRSLETREMIGSKLCPLTSYISCQGISHGLPPTRQTTYAQRMARNMELL